MASQANAAVVRACQASRLQIGWCGRIITSFRAVTFRVVDKCAFKGFVG